MFTWDDYVKEPKKNKKKPATLNVLHDVSTSSKIT